MSIADLQCFMELHQPITMNCFTYEGFPKIAAWFDKMMENEGVKEVLNLPENTEVYATWRKAAADFDEKAQNNMETDDHDKDA